MSIPCRAECTHTNNLKRSVVLHSIKNLTRLITQITNPIRKQACFYQHEHHLPSLLDLSSGSNVPATFAPRTFIARPKRWSGLLPSRNKVSRCRGWPHRNSWQESGIGNPPGPLTLWGRPGCAWAGPGRRPASPGAHKLAANNAAIICAHPQPAAGGRKRIRHLLSAFLDTPTRPHLFWS